MRVLAIDPGYDRLGVAVMERIDGKETLLHSTCIETDREASIPQRLHAVGEAIRALLTEYNPDSFAIETLFFNTNQKTAIAVAGARGMVIYLAMHHGCTVYEYAPQEIKMAATGYGKSDKKAVFDMLFRLVPNLPTGKRDDEYDAVAIAVTCLAHNRR